MQFEELGTDYLITLTNEEANDLMTVEVELKEFSDDYPRLQALTREITRQLKDEIQRTDTTDFYRRATTRRTRIQSDINTRYLSGQSLEYVRGIRTLQ